MAGKLKRSSLKRSVRKRTTVFGYRAGKTLLHRTPAGLKLIFVIIISAFAFTSVYGLCASAFLLLMACVLARMPTHSLLKGSKPIVILSLCVIVLKSINPEGEGITTPEISFYKMYIQSIYIPFISGEGFLKGLLTAFGLFVPFAAAALLFSVTTMRELRLSLAFVEKNVIRKFPRKGAETQRRRPRVATSKFKKQMANMLSAKEKEEGHVSFFSLGISLMLGFIPRFFEMWDDANLACDSRSCKRGLRRMFLLLPLVMERMMETSANTALAIEARGFN
ncbi:MAG: energy-coupling factor transporter transmembrane protein EcfT [Treponema sp.]|jgi:biotin transport system permease protein|nr:energy-coupling factor transporter transmembrane protein EcfT [Treponema sp.]